MRTLMPTETPAKLRDYDTRGSSQDACSGGRFRGKLGFGLVGVGLRYAFLPTHALLATHAPMMSPDALFSLATRQWPLGWLKKESFAEYVAERAGDEELSDEAVAALYLTCACVRGIPAAVKAFDSDYLPQAERAALRAGLSKDQVSDLLQVLREHLLVGRPGGTPKLREYRGKGDLRGWLRVTATRAALRVRKKVANAKMDPEDASLEARATDEDPELSYMKALYRQAFRAAFQAAVLALDAREKLVLHQHTVDGLSVDEIGAKHGVHRATAARWVQAAREKLLTGVRRELAREVNVSPRELNSILRLVQSRFDVTMRRLLA
jgi:RNA polymerase sigma-70 factor (ECF subfamily)